MCSERKVKTVRQSTFEKSKSKINVTERGKLSHCVVLSLALIYSLLFWLCNFTPQLRDHTASLYPSGVPLRLKSTRNCKIRFMKDSVLFDMEEKERDTSKDRSGRLSSEWGRWASNVKTLIVKQTLFSVKQSSPGPTRQRSLTDRELLSDC